MRARRVSALSRYERTALVSIRFSLVWLQLLSVFSTLLVTLAMSEAQPTPPQIRYYFAIENLDNGQIFRRGKFTKPGAAPEPLIIQSQGRYRCWLLNAENRTVGFSEFTTPRPGQRFSIPGIPLGIPTCPDSDGDGLSDDAELILGCNPLKADTDGDGIDDGASLALGIEPDHIASSRTGIIGSVDTPGLAVDVCAINNLAVVADSDRGITVFNVFNRMAPLVIAQVDTPGTAQAVACSGNLVAVADGAAGLAVIDITDPNKAAIQFQIGVNQFRGGDVIAVAAVGDLAFIGTAGGVLAMVEMSSQLILYRAELGTVIYDLALEGDNLFVLRGNELRAYSYGRGVNLLGTVGVSGLQPEGITGRRRLFVGGGEALITSYPGFDRVNASNPAAMVLTGTALDRGENSYKQIIANGSGLGVATVGTNPRDDGTHDLYFFNLTNITQTTNRLGTPGTLFTPGIARAVSLYNGMAYVADSASGLQVINYLAFDSGGLSPTGRLTTSITGIATNGTLSEGSRIILRAEVADDVMVRNVEFRVNGVRYLVDGNFPFEVGWRAPAVTNTVFGTNLSITAVATDTGGNETNLGPINLVVTPDTEPPSIGIIQPTNNAPVIAGDLIPIELSLFDNVGVDPNSVEIFVNGVRVSVYRQPGQWLIESPLRWGTYQLTVRASDYSGHATNSVPINLRVREQAGSREYSAFNFGNSVINDAVSREWSAFNFGGDTFGKDAISREWSFFNLGVTEQKDAISREVSVENRTP